MPAEPACAVVSVDRASPVPLYYQLAQQLEAGHRRRPRCRRATGSGTRSTLADRLGLSRPTVRQAIQDLVGKGLLVRKRGVGTQVVQPAGRTAGRADQPATTT